MGIALLNLSLRNKEIDKAECIELIEYVEQITSMLLNKQV
jgi:hypothetical protein